MIAALLFYLGASAALIAVEARLANRASTDAVQTWITRHLYTPLLRTLMLAGFIVIAYPAVLGLDSAPPLVDVLRDGHADLLITTLFVSSLALPLVPVISSLPGAVLTTQGILGCCLLTAWVGESVRAAPPDYWMGWPVTVEIIAILIIGRLAARALVRQSAARPPAQAALIDEALRLATALPAILLYGWALGYQLGPAPVR